MKLPKHWTWFAVLGVLMFSCTKDTVPTYTTLDRELQLRLTSLSPDRNLEHFTLPFSHQLADIPQDPANPLTPEKVELGKLLFYETGLARNPIHAEGLGTYSCATCHVPEFGFVPGRAQGIADGGLGSGQFRTKFNAYDSEEVDAQGARPLSMLNVAYVTNTTWSGKFGAGDANVGTEAIWGETDPATEVNKQGLSGLESQNMEGLALHRMDVNRGILDEYGYVPYFDRAFPEISAHERYNQRTAALALSAYIRSLLPTEAPYQRWLRGDLDAMSLQQKRGAQVFFGKANCGSCHNGPSLSHTDFYAIGVKDLYQTGTAVRTDAFDKRNLGRGGFTERAEDMYKFKIPQLYNLKHAGFYFHGSSKHSLREVVEYFNEGVAENANVPERQLAHQFVPLGLTDQEIEDLTEFLENGLYDADLQRFVPDSVLSGNCFPNNDQLSRIEQGCE